MQSFVNIIIVLTPNFSSSSKYMALYFVRHGQTDWNLQRRFQSRSDIPLNATGISQAKCIQTEFRKRKLNFQAVYSSPMGRAVETAKIIITGSGLTIQIEPSFVELDLGDFEGGFEDDLSEKYGENYRVWRASAFTIAAPGGETIFEAASRVTDALFGMKQSAIDGDVLIVAHQNIFMAMKAAISGQHDIETIATYKQANDEVDVWDFATGCMMERILID